MKFLCLTVSTLIALPVFADLPPVVTVPAPGKVLALGEQDFVGGVPVSCNAPLLAEGKFRAKCRVEWPSKPTEMVEIEYVARVDLNSKQHSEILDRAITDRGLKMAEFYSCSPIFGPYK